MLRLPPRGEIAFPIPKVQRTLCTNVKRMERDAIRIDPAQVESSPQPRVDHDERRADQV
jgi:hypothetical protein